jgi:AhpD family alkylhydroperoxidase
MFPKEETVQARMKNPATVLPGVATGVKHLVTAARSTGLPGSTLELVHLRASQINGCSACVWTAVQAGHSDDESQKLWAVSAWREAPCFDDAERAALSLAEHVTRLADLNTDAVPDELWAELTKHYDEEQLAALILWTATTNFFNRLNATVKEPAGTVWS